MNELSFIESKGILKKAERLVSAVFIVSDLIRDEEPIKDKIKILSIQLISLSIRFSRQDTFTTKTGFELEICVSELISLLNISAFSGFITEMNASILKSEFKSFLKNLSSINQNSGFK